MKAKVFLSQIQKLDKLIENKMIEVQHWKEVARNTTTSLEGERVQSTHNPHRIEDAIANYIDLETEIKKDISLLIEKRKSVVGVIEQLNPTEYDLLHKIYVQGITLQDAADACGNSYSWVTTTHGRALKQVQIILDNMGEQCTI